MQGTDLGGSKPHRTGRVLEAHRPGENPEAQGHIAGWGLSGRASALYTPSCLHPGGTMLVQEGGDLPPEPVGSVCPVSSSCWQTSALSPTLAPPAFPPALPLPPSQFLLLSALFSSLSHSLVSDNWSSVPLHWAVPSSAQDPRECDRLGSGSVPWGLCRSLTDHCERPSPHLYIGVTVLPSEGQCGVSEGRGQGSGPCEVPLLRAQVQSYCHGHLTCPFPILYVPRPPRVLPPRWLRPAKWSPTSGDRVSNRLGCWHYPSALSPSAWTSEKLEK